MPVPTVVARHRERLGSPLRVGAVTTHLFRKRRRRGSASRATLRSRPPRATRRSPRAGSTLIATTGIRDVRTSFSSRRRAASAPSMSGSRRSIRMTSGTCSSASAIPSAPVRGLEGLEPVPREGRHPSELPVSVVVVDDQDHAAPAYPPAMPIRLVLAEDHLPRPRGRPAAPRDASPTSRSAAVVRRPRRPARRGGRGGAGRRRHRHPHAAGQHGRGDPGGGAVARDPSRRRASSCSASTPPRAIALALLEGGSAGRSYLLKERVQDVEQLVSAIRTVAEGGSVIDPKVVEALVAENARGEESRLNQLTPRERRRPARDGGRKEQRGDRGIALPRRALGREGDPLDLPQARSELGGVGPQARQGRDPLPRPRTPSLIPRAAREPVTA